MKPRLFPVIPIALRGMWGSISSRKNGAAFSKLPRRLRSPVEVNVGMPVMPSQVSPELLQGKVEELRGDWQ